MRVREFHHRQTATPAETESVAAKLGGAGLIRPPFCVYLSGPLAAGKTLWVRALLRAAGCAADVPSPSYALAYSYVADGVNFHHLDCYRLQGREAGEDVLSLFEECAVLLVEWPENAAWLPAADLRVTITLQGGDRRRIGFAAAAAVAARLSPMLAGDGEGEGRGKC